MLCERGVRTFSDFSRNTLDLAVVPGGGYFLVADEFLTRA